jgi:hypothetical protein
VPDLRVQVNEEVWAEAGAARVDSQIAIVRCDMGTEALLFARLDSLFQVLTFWLTPPFAQQFPSDSQ